jgi:hypothetical protein
MFHLAVLLLGKILRSSLLKETDMQRKKDAGGRPTPRPVGNWLAGAMIGVAIMTMATQAMILGAGAAIQDATLKGR